MNQITKRVLEAALEAEMSEHLGYDKHEFAGRDGGNSRNGIRTKTVLTEIGPVQIDVPRDTDASFAPQIVKKRQRRLTGTDRSRTSPAAAASGLPRTPDMDRAARCGPGRGRAPQLASH